VKKLLLSTVLALGWFAAPVAPAHAQTPANCGVNFNPVIGVNCANIRTATYVGQIINLAPASAATDIWCIDASATKNVHIRRVSLSGTATAVATIPVNFIRRNTLDTGGTSSTPNITSFSTNNPTATAPVIQYTANPTLTDTTSHQTIRDTILTLGPTTPVAGELPSVVQWDFGTAVDAYDQGADLAKNSTQQFCINWGGATTAGNALYGTVEWTED
jgi:hypothetical protein